LILRLTSLTPAKCPQAALPRGSPPASDFVCGDTADVVVGFSRSAGTVPPLPAMSSNAAPRFTARASFVVAGLVLLVTVGAGCSSSTTGGTSTAAKSTAAPSTSSTAAKEPPLTVPTSMLSAALHCHGALSGATEEPIMFVTGTDTTGEQGYAFGKSAFDHFGHPVCDVNFPNSTTADVQMSVQYLVYGIRQEFQLSGRPIAVYGVSQGGLLARFALTYWTDLRAKVTDVIAAAGTMHGTALIEKSVCSASHPCAPADWQQRAGSNLLAALNAQPVEAPGPTSWTTVRSADDDVVQPQAGAHPTSALRGASNILIQGVCPARRDNHLATFVDSVTFAAIVDALSHPGPAEVSRFPKNVCSHPYAPGLSTASTNVLLASAKSLINEQGKAAPTVPAEPKVLSYFR
jgi:triacylglycerol lipase